MHSKITVVGKAAIDALPEVKLVLDNLSEQVLEDEGKYTFLPIADFEDVFNGLLRLYQIRYFHPLSA